MKRSFHQLSSSSDEEAPRKKPRALQDRDDSDDEAPQESLQELGDSDVSEREEKIVRVLCIELTNKVCAEVPTLVTAALNKSVCEVLPDFVFESWCEAVEDVMPVADEVSVSLDGEVTVRENHELVSLTTVGESLEMEVHEKLSSAVQNAMAGVIFDTWLDHVEPALEKLIQDILNKNDHRFRDEMLYDDLVDELREKFEDGMTEDVLGYFIGTVIDAVDEHAHTVRARNAYELTPNTASSVLTEDAREVLHDAVAEVADHYLPPLGATVCWALCRRIEQVLREPCVSWDTDSAGGFSDSDTAVTCDEVMEDLTLGERRGSGDADDEGTEGDDDEDGGECDYESSDGEGSDDREESGKEEEHGEDEDEDDDEDESGYGGDEEDNDDDETQQERDGDVGMGGI